MFAPIWKGYFPEENHVGHVTNGVHLPCLLYTSFHYFGISTNGFRIVGGIIIFKIGYDMLQAHFTLSLIHIYLT